MHTQINRIYKQILGYQYVYFGWRIDKPLRVGWRSQISIATGRRGFLEENLTGSPKAEARAGAVIE